MRFPNKYRNIPTIIDGKRFASRKEGRRYQELTLLQKAGEITHLQCQVRFPLWVNGELCTTYIADFCYRINGQYIIEDVKGMRKGPAYNTFKIKKNLLWAVERLRIKEV